MPIYTDYSFVVDDDHVCTSKRELIEYLGISKSTINRTITIGSGDHPGRIMEIKGYKIQIIEKREGSPPINMKQKVVKYGAYELTYSRRSGKLINTRAIDI
jgi:hypothetical protein